LVRLSSEPSLRPDLPPGRPPRAGAVNDGLRPPPQAARSVIDRTEHEGMLTWQAGTEDTTPPKQTTQLLCVELIAFSLA
jgi:hypothetical protein